MMHAAARGFLLILGVAVVIFTALPLLRANAWWVRIFDFPRVQVLFLGFAVLALHLLFFRPFGRGSVVLLLLIAAALAYQAWCIFPYTTLAGKEVRSAQNEKTVLRLLVANVLMFNRNHTGLRRIIADARPDIVLAVETDLQWQEQLDQLKSEFPFTLSYPLENTYGMLLYSRYEIVRGSVHFLLKKDIPSIEAQIRLPSGELIELWGLHPEPPVPRESRSSAPRDAELLLVGKKVRDLGRPVIVAGDLNDVAWSRTTRLFRRVSGLLDPRIGRGRYNTFHANYPLMRCPLDHVFHSDHFRFVDMQVLPGFGSDHFPILAVLSLEPERREEQGGPEPADRGDLKEAREEIREGEKEVGNR